MVIAARYTVGSLPIAALRFDEAVDAILGARVRGDRFSFHFCTAHSVVETSRSETLRQALSASHAVNTSDGMPLVWVGRLKGHRTERVYGPDVMLAVLKRGRASGYRHYFYGGAPGVAEQLATRMTTMFPGLHVVGVESPPFRKLAEAEDDEMIRRINEAAPDCVWVGLGAPKQDFWVHEHRAVLDAPVLLAVGAAFDFHSGLKRQAPLWMQRHGTEWLFRLVSEPRRLWRRYTLTNVAFLSVLLNDLARATALTILRSRRRSR